MILSDRRSLQLSADMLLLNSPAVAPTGTGSFASLSAGASRASETSLSGDCNCALHFGIAGCEKPPSNSLPRFRFASESLGSVWRYRHVCFGVGAIFLAVGGEVAVGSFLVNYLTLPDIGGLIPKTAAVYVSLYWGGSLAGRFIGSAVMRLWPAPKVLGVAAVIVVTLLLTTVSSTGAVAM